MSRATITLGWLVVAGLVVAGLVVAGCGTFQDPNVVLDLRVLAIAESPPDQVITVDVTQPPDPLALAAQLVPTQVCALIADPGADRRLVWSMKICPFGATATGERCDETQAVAVGSGAIDDPDTTVPAPTLCATIDPNGALLGVIAAALEADDLKGLGGIDINVQLQVGGEGEDRALDQYASKTLRVSPRIPDTRTANHNPRLDHIDATVDGGPATPVTLGRCVDNPTPLEVAAGTKLRLTPVEPADVRETYVVPTLDGKSQTFTESLTYQWVASGGGFTDGATGGPRDLAGNPAPLFTDFKATAAADLDGPLDVVVWIVQRDERLGVQWYEACLRVVPPAP